MLHIAVCDDDIKMLGEVKQILTDYCKAKKLSFKISAYCDGTDLLATEESFSIIFLDIEMQHSNGIEVAQKIRRMDMNVPIVYITSYIDYWRRAYKVHAFDFIVKPFKTEDLYKVMKDYLAALDDASEKTITLPTDDGVVCFKMNDIYYFTFEAKKKVYVHTVDGRVLVRENLTEIYNMLNKDRFYQARRECILNLKYVQKIRNKFVIIMKNGDMLPLAQKKKDEFVRKLSNVFVETLKGKIYE